MTDKQSYEELVQRVEELQKQIESCVSIEERLKENDRMLAAVQKLAKLGIWIWDIKSGEITWSEEVYEIFGFDARRYKPDIDSIMERFYPDDRSHHQELIERVKVRGFHNIEARILVPNKEIRYISSTLEAQYDDDGNAIKILGIVQDVTEHKLAGEALRSSEERYRSLFDGALDMIHIVDANGILIDANRSELEILGYRKEEFLGMPLLDIIHPDYREDTGRVLKEALAGKVIGGYETMMLAKDGHSVPVEVRAVPQVRGGNVASVRAILRDVTDRKILEETIHRLVDVSSRRFGESFFQSMALELASTLKADYVIIGELQESVMKSIKTLAVATDGILAANFEYDLANTPCETVAGKGVRSYVSNAADRFSKSKLLSEMGVEGYVGAPLFDFAGRPLGIVAVLYRTPVRNANSVESILQVFSSRIGSEIERAHAEQALKESEETSRALLNAPTESLILLDRKGICLALNETTAKRIGRSPEEIVGMDIKEMFPPELAQSRMKNLEYVLETGEPIQFEDERAGAYYYNQYYPIRGREGQVARVAVFAQDITEQRQAEKALVEERDKLARYLDLANFIFVALDLDGTVRLINRKGCEVLGYTEEEIVGQNWFENFLPSGIRVSVKEVFNQLMRGGTELTEYHENQIVTREGKMPTIAWYNAYVRSTDGEISGVISCGEDITERLALESQLRQTQKLEAIGQLAGGIAHDFNNILSAILGYADMAYDDTKDLPEAQSCIDEVISAGRRAQGLISQILAFSRRQIMRPVTVNLNTIVEETGKMLRRVIGEHIKYDFIPSHLPLHIRADRAMIAQILINLCVNARDAMPDGGELKIETKSVHIDSHFCRTHAWAKTPGVYNQLIVTDSGYGMDKDVKDRIFEPFFSTKGEGEGTGLGLSTVYGIVQQHKGMIDIYSEPGMGTTFDIYLPAIEREADDLEIEKDEETRGGDETVLLVEDDKSVQMVVMQMLEKAGYKVLAACSGKEGIEMFMKDPDVVDLVLLDVVMPEMGGLEAYHRMCIHRSDLPGLFMSGYSEKTIHTDFVLKEGLRLLQKPFTRDGLLQAVRRTLDESGH